MEKRVTLEIDNDIAYVTLNRPDKYNGIDMDMFHGITKIAQQLKKDCSVRAVILQGAGKVFCSGLDVKSVSSNPINFGRLLVKPGRKISNLAQDVGYLWREVPAPVIAVTHGVCYGGGLQIALGADFRYSTPDCEFSIMEAKWGLIPDLGGTWRLPRLIGLGRATEMTLSARQVDAEEALAMGLAEIALPAQGATEAAHDLATRLAAGPGALRRAPRLLRENLTRDRTDALAAEAAAQQQCLAGPDFVEAVTAHLQGREPSFQGS